LPNERVKTKFVAGAVGDCRNTRVEYNIFLRYINFIILTIPVLQQKTYKNNQMNLYLALEISCQCDDLQAEFCD
jgi:hypothetical protein